MAIQINKTKTVGVSVLSTRVVGASVGIVSSKASGQGGSNAIQPQQVIYKRYHIQTPQTVWTINHNLNTDRFLVVLRDEQGEIFEAKINRLNSKTIEVHLATALSGFVDLVVDVSTNPVIAV